MKIKNQSAIRYGSNLIDIKKDLPIFAYKLDEGKICSFTKITLSEKTETLMLKGLSLLRGDSLETIFVCKLH